MELLASEPKKQSQLSRIADLFAYQCRSHNLPPYIREYKFALAVKRQWRFDFCWNLPAGMYGLKRPIRLAVEIEGIVMRQVRIIDPATKVVTVERIMGGRHATITGFKEDCIKYGTASLLGWEVLRFEQSQVKSKFALGLTMRKLHRLGYRAQTIPKIH